MPGDPMLTARAVIYERLEKDIPDAGRRHELSVAIAVQLDMMKLLRREAPDAR